jgi:MFS family permease
MLFLARVLQGAADAVTWVVGFALIADLYGEDERGPRDGAGDGRAARWGSSSAR